MSQVNPSEKRALTEVKQIIHIELCEAEFKRRKVELEKGRKAMRSWTNLAAKQSDLEAKAEPTKEPDDLEMIGGTSEDDFSEAIALIRFVVSIAAAF